MTLLGKITKNILAPIVCFFDKILVKLNIHKPYIVMYMDGGLCSQMDMWINGEYYREQGFDVYYDLDWYRRSGKGIDGKSLRNYELQTLWPNIEVRILSKRKNDFCKYFLPYEKVSCLLPNAESIHRTIYFNGYNWLEPQEKERLYREWFSLKNVTRTDKMGLQSGLKYCGVHVRRGDLANVSLDTYPQVSEGYFLHAINYVQSTTTVDKFLFFSDDPRWVKDNILPYVSENYDIMIGNKGYEDLILLSQCDVIISSQGSFGYTAALINGKCSLFIANESRRFGMKLATKMVAID